MKRKDKICYVCGNENNLTFHKKVTLDTTGCNVTANNAYVCNLCKNRIRK